MEKTKKETATVDYVSYRKSIPRLLDTLNAGEILASQRQILIKPNLINASPPPVTTPVECCAAIVEYVRNTSEARVFIAEGCGAADRETREIFDQLGYTGLTEQYDIKLVDLNSAETAITKCADCDIFPEMHLPRIAFDSYIISVPVLKAHSLAEITGTMKNMMGFAPPAHYQRGGHWKKSAFHRRIHQSIRELNRHVTPDLTVLDASVGLAEYHLGGPECKPRVNRLLAGFDPRAIDRCAAEMLDLHWEKIPHLT